MSDEMVSVVLSPEYYRCLSIVDDERLSGGVVTNDGVMRVMRAPTGEWIGHVVQATPEQVARWKAALDAFLEVQKEMGGLFNAASAEARERAAKEQAEREAAERVAAERRQREREAKRRAEIKARNAMWKKIEASDGVLYDADGNPGGGRAVAQRSPEAAVVTITEFLLARLAEDEAVARAAPAGPWRKALRADGSIIGLDQQDGYDDAIWPGEVSCMSYCYGGTSTIEASEGAWDHIARHDPARVLREVAAKRRVIELCEQWPIMVEAMNEPRRWLTTEAYRAETDRDWPSTDPMIRALASVYSDHEDWREEWA